MRSRVHGLPLAPRAIAAVLTVWLAACSSVPPPRFHTLLPASSTVAPGVVPVSPVAWEVLPVAIPAQVDQPQWVVRTADGSLAVLEQERWIAPLGEELRAAVADRLTRTLGASAAPEPSGKVWRVRIDVQRIDTIPSREVRLEANWILRSSVDATAALRCHGDFVQAIPDGGYPALAKGHQLAVARLADVIARALGALSAGQAASCGA